MHDVDETDNSIYTLTPTYVRELADRITDAGIASAVRFYFDDGWGSLTTIVPLLRQRHPEIEVVLAIVTGWVGEPRNLSWDQLRDLAALGARVCAHSLDHPDMTTLSRPQRLRQLTLSQELLHQQLLMPFGADQGAAGPHRPREFVLPYGRYDQALLELNAEHQLYEHITTTEYAWDRGGQLRPRLMLTRERTAAQVLELLASEPAGA